MPFIHSALFWIHIVFGSLALVLFWVPVFTKKGQLNHVKFGHHFKTCMYMVSFTGLLMACLVIYAPLVIRPEFIEHNNPQAVASYLRVFGGFLALLAFLSFVSTRHGIRVLQVKDDRTELRKWHYLLPIFCLIVGGLLYIYLGSMRSQMLHLIFGIIACIVGLNILRYCLRASVPKRSYILEHIGAIIGSGIAAYTAFLTFGSRRLLDLGDYQLVVWIAPGVIGSIASYMLCKKYAALFNLSSG